MGFTLGTLQTSAYDHFFWGIWAVGVALLLALLSVVSILISQFSSQPQDAGVVPKLLRVTSAPTAAAP